MTPRATITAVGALAVAAELSLGALGLLAIGPERIVVYLLASAAATAAMTGAMRRLLRPRPGNGESRGGGLGTGPDGPPPGWWPAFEAEFRAYADGRSKTPA